MFLADVIKCEAFLQLYHYSQNFQNFHDIDAKFFYSAVFKQLEKFKIFMKNFNRWNVFDSIFIFSIVILPNSSYIVGITWLHLDY